MYVCMYVYISLFKSIYLSILFLLFCNQNFELNTIVLPFLFLAIPNCFLFKNIFTFCLFSVFETIRVRIFIMIEYV